MFLRITTGFLQHKTALPAIHTHNNLNGHFPINLEFGMNFVYESFFSLQSFYVRFVY